MVQVLIIYGLDDDVLAREVGNRLLSEQRNIHVFRYEGPKYQSLESRYEERTGKKMEYAELCCEAFDWKERCRISDEMNAFFNERIKPSILHDISKLKPNYTIELHSTCSSVVHDKIRLAPVQRDGTNYINYLSLVKFLEKKYQSDSPYNWYPDNAITDNWWGCKNIEVTELIHPNPFKDKYIDIGVTAIKDLCEFLNNKDIN